MGLLGLRIYIRINCFKSEDEIRIYKIINFKIRYCFHYFSNSLIPSSKNSVNSSKA